MTENSELFNGKVAVITGASTGIGLGLSRKLLQNGAKVYMSSRTPAHIAEAATSLRQYGDRVHAQVLDVRDEAAVADYMDFVAGQERVDYLFCNAGVGYGRPYVESTRREHWEVVFDVNVFGVANCVHHLLPRLVEQGRGHVVIVSSVAGITPLPYQSIYVASKHAVLGFANSLRYELEDKGVGVSVVCPAAVATNIWYRDLDYSLHFDWPVPADAISIDQAGQEILDGIRAGQRIIPVQDEARRLYEAVKPSDPQYLETIMNLLKDAGPK